MVHRRRPARKTSYGSRGMLYGYNQEMASSCAPIRAMWRGWTGSASALARSRRSAISSKLILPGAGPICGSGSGSGSVPASAPPPVAIKLSGRPAYWLAPPKSKGPVLRSPKIVYLCWLWLSVALPY
ncbi:hypothetical protein J3459_009774 [Metarhizium acridum]|nr:hypothetical protein J3459_009774 [Metarhizium acridum]